jgi:hypothetical protein
MAKKNKTKPINSLSPEAYIRQRARSLPIFECYITKSWDEDKLATIVVSRKHTNGNITFAVYLTDLLCLGVKDSFYRFNETERKFREIIENINDNHEMEKTEYPLAHNIILAANEFAEEFDLYPCKEFTKVTQYMLEEDTDDIELMEIECGMEGKPAVIFGMHNEVEGKRILNHLRSKVGEGNYHFIEEFDLDLDGEDDEDEDENEDEEWHEEDDEDFDTLREKFIRLSEESVKENPSVDDIFKYIYVSKKLILHFADSSKINNYTEFFRNEFDLDVVEEPDAEIFGIDPNDTKLLKKCHNSLESVLKRYDPEKIKRVKKSIDKLSDLPEKIRELPFFVLLADMMLKNLNNLENESDIEEEYLLTSFTGKFPQHPVSRIMETREKLRRLLNSEYRMIEPLFRIGDYFGDRNKLHLFEFKVFLSLYEDYIIEKEDVDMLCAFDELTMERGSDDLIAQHLTMTFFNIKEIIIRKKLEMG